MQAMPLTPRQRDCLAFLQVAFSEGDVSPSYEEIMDAMGLTSKSGVHRLIVDLEKRGRIKRMPAHARSIKVIAPLKRSEVETKSSRELLAARLREHADRLESAQ